MRKPIAHIFIHRRWEDRETLIGDNVIIGAGSVISGTIPSNCVTAAGIPVKVICSLDTYYEKRLNNPLSEAVLYTKRFFGYYNRKPFISEMESFYFLFLERNIESMHKHNIKNEFVRRY